MAFGKMAFEQTKLAQDGAPVQDLVAERLAGAKARPLLSRAVLVLCGVFSLSLYTLGLLFIWSQLERVLPDQLSLNLFHHTATVHHIHQKISDNGLLLFLLIPLVLAIEAMSTGWEKSSVRRILFARSATIKMDLAYIIADQAQLVTLISKLLTFGISVGFGLWIHDRLSALLHINIGLSALPVWAQVFGYFWAATFFDYWTHRLDHSKAFWPIHRFHHSTEDFCVITALRSHPANFTGLFFVNLPMAILGAPVEVMITINLVVMIIGLLIHSSIDSNWGWFGRWVIQSPNHHRLHHILDYRANGVGHYSMAPIWDHLFGTWKGEADQSLPIGVDEPYRHGYWFMHDLMRDYIDFWKALTRAVVGMVKRPAS